jgi:hypothetical protein
MGDYINTITIKADIQENGIIRIAETGLFIGRLDGVGIESVLPFKIPTYETEKQITVGADQFEHLLNCMCNQKFIHEQNEETQKEWQEIIDKSYDEARTLLSPLQVVVT